MLFSHKWDLALLYYIILNIIYNIFILQFKNIDIKYTFNFLVYIFKVILDN